jgi:glycosyltransferase involved in cell wall biosynthesis
MWSVARTLRGVTLVVLHYHYRPGGVRRVIELGLPGILRSAGRRAGNVLLAGGEAPPEEWLSALRRSIPEVVIEFVVYPQFGYAAKAVSGGDRADRPMVQACRDLLARAGPAPLAVWAHNLSLGRNLALAASLASACRRRRVRLILHHHDWWFDNRWEHLPREVSQQRAGSDRVARWLLPSAGAVRHVAINRSDAGILTRHFGRAAAWVPNPVIATGRPSASAVRAARHWLTEQLGDSAPVWLVPCRLLRRKNLGEAILLARWFRPEAWLVTTAGVSSPGESAYGGRMEALVRREGWRVRFGILARSSEVRSPSVESLLQASEAVLLTSLIEGFGLPYIEAAAARRPLIARALENVVPDLRRLGVRLPYLYPELWIDPALFDVAAERRRQRVWFEQLKSRIPSAWSRRLTEPTIIDESRVQRAIAFSRLSLSAQIEVLQVPPEQSWRSCRALNPGLVSLASRAASGRLEPAELGRGAEVGLSVATFGRRLLRLIDREVPRRDSGAGRRTQADLIMGKLKSTNLYPLLAARSEE